MGFSLVPSGLFVAVLAVVIVIGRVLWPREWFQALRDERRFRTSVREMRQGMAQLDEERYDNAIALFKLAAEKTPGKPAPVLLRIYALGLQGRRREAAGELQRARQRWQSPTLPRRLLALAYLGAGEFDRAYVTAQEASEEQPIAPLAQKTLGDVCRIVERYPEAERAYLRATRMGVPRPYSGLAWALVSQGRVDEAEEELALAPQAVLRLFESQLALAQIHLQSRRLEDAVVIYQSLLQEHRDVPRVLVPYAQTLSEMNRFDEALQVLQHAVAVSSDDPFAHAAYANLLTEHGDLALATVNVRDALRLWPGYGTARSIYGDILKRASRYDAAEEQYRDALRLNPFLAETHTRLASLLRARGEVPEAQEHEREAQRLRPTTPRPITQEILALATQQLQMVAPANTFVPTRPRSERTMAGSMAPVDPAPAPVGAISGQSQPMFGMGTSQEGFAAPMPGFSRTDIAVYPGAALLFDESRDSFFTQTLQTDKPPRVVLTFYRQNMTQEGWQLMREEGSMLAHIEGITLRFRRGNQESAITVGFRPGHGEHGNAPMRLTYIVTQVFH